MKTWPIATMALKSDADIVAVRQRARVLAELLGFERQDQTRIATAVSEIARNAYSYAQAGRVEFALVDDVPQLFQIRVSDRGPGIADRNAVLEGRHRSASGAGGGINAARRLLDVFQMQSAADGTVVEMAHHLPPRAPRIMPEALRSIVAAMVQRTDSDPIVALHEQNRELLQSLEDVRRRQEEANQLNRELEDTNRGVVALYAELDSRAEQLREASEIKSRFLSNMSHEFRTPLNSILALSGLLTDGVDGGLTGEQARQIGYIRRSAQELLDLVNDLLDLAKVEAGKLDLRPTQFTIEDLFSALRGVLRPLRHSAEVELFFDSAQDLPPLFTDEGKLAQVLRNFISNALRFTERGEVRVAAHYDSAGQTMLFTVSDTGIGIDPANHARIFEDFTQLEGRLHRKVGGTGLGLPLSRKLAQLLGGEVWVQSELGAGAQFFLSVPVRIESTTQPRSDRFERKRVLVVDDDETFRYVLRQIIGEQLHHEVIEAADGESGLEQVRIARPDLVVLDLQMPRMDGFSMLDRLRADVVTQSMPVIVATSLRLDPELNERLPADVTLLSKQAITRERVQALLDRALYSRGERRE